MATTPTELHVALTGQYTIQGEIGYGGMATVYLADDCKHDRQVAVKVLRRELAATIGTDRFLREIAITARLNHPNILPLLDSGRAGDFLFYVMPYVSGESLRSLLNQDGTVPLRTAARIVREVSGALEHAHRHGVIHRDVKPENILISEGVAVVADFGIARALTIAGPDSLTRSGVPLGTLGYMSPEQASGRQDLDPRTDVCSLACVAFEMIIGETPGAWTTPQEVLLGRFEEILLEHRARLDEFPGRVEQVLVQGLAIRRGERFASPTEFAEAFASACAGSTSVPHRDVDRLLKRAVVLDAGRDTSEPALSLGGVEQIAAQVGIPPARVREALNGISAPTPSTAVEHRETVRREPAGWPTKVVVDRVVDQRLDPSTYDSVVEAIHSTLGEMGHSSTLGGTLVWTSTPTSDAGRDVRVTLRQHQGQTHIHIEEDLALRGFDRMLPGWGTAGGVILGAGIGAAFGGAEGSAVSMAAFMGFVGWFTAARMILNAHGNARAPEISKLADQLVAIVWGATER